MVNDIYTFSRLFSCNVIVLVISLFYSTLFLSLSVASLMTLILPFKPSKYKPGHCRIHEQSLPLLIFCQIFETRVILFPLFLKNFVFSIWPKHVSPWLCASVYWTTTVAHSCNQTVYHQHATQGQSKFASKVAKPTFHKPGQTSFVSTINTHGASGTVKARAATWAHFSLTRLKTTFAFLLFVEGRAHHSIAFTISGYIFSKKKQKSGRTKLARLAPSSRPTLFLCSLSSSGDYFHLRNLQVKLWNPDVFYVWHLTSYDGYSKVQYSTVQYSLHTAPWLLSPDQHHQTVRLSWPNHSTIHPSPTSTLNQRCRSTVYQSIPTFLHQAHLLQLQPLHHYLTLFIILLQPPHIYLIRAYLTHPSRPWAPQCFLTLSKIIYSTRVHLGRNSYILHHHPLPHFLLAQNRL